MREFFRTATAGHVRALAVALCHGLAVSAAVAAPAPTGPVVLTVAGNVAHANRPPFDEKVDVFLNYHEQTFDRAFVFDLDMLERLGMTDVVVSYADWDAPYSLSGPRLTDVLEAAGCSGEMIATLALDGFATEIAASEIEARNWVVTTRASGRPHGLGDRGPLWLVFDLPGDRPATAEEEGMWPWALFFIWCGAR